MKQRPRTMGVLGQKLLEKLGGKRPGRAPEPSIESNWLNKDEPKKPGAPSARPKKAPMPPLIPEHATQFPDSEQRETTDVVIGLDFGTSSSKIVLQDPVLRNFMAVPSVSPPTSLASYLFPTAVFLDDDGLVGLAGSGQCVKGLKIHLMEHAEQAIAANSSLTVVGLSAAYIALLLRIARVWFLSTKRDAYRQSPINWLLNIGMPSRSYDETVTKKNFIAVAQAAWWLSVQDAPISESIVNTAMDKVASSDFDPGIDKEQIHVYPEIAAEVTGYTRSDARQDGLHMMIDVGASTLDVSTFTLHKQEGDDNYSFLAVDVKNLGAYFLHQYRIREISNFVRSKFDPLDDRSPIPQSNESLLPTRDDLDDIDFKFLSGCVGVINPVVLKTKGEKYATAPQFHLKNPEQFPVFLCGGGSQLEFYRRVLRRSEKQLRASGVAIGQWQPKSLPKPERLEAPTLSAKDFHRLAVAYGLSFLFLDLGKVVPPLRNR